MAAYGLHSELDAPTYPVAEAARLVGLTAGRIRRWLQGYFYEYAAPGQPPSRRRQDPVVQRDGTEGSHYALFLDLVDLLLVKQFLDYGISLQKVRRALDEATQVLGTNHFAREKFFTDGDDIFLEIQDPSDAIVELLSGGQLVIAGFIRELAYRVEFDQTTGLACRWFPLGRDKVVVLDPQISFGRPSIIRRGITTANIYDLYEAESGNLDNVCRWACVPKDEARQAILFEKRLSA